MGAIQNSISIDDIRKPSYVIVYLWKWGGIGEIYFLVDSFSSDSLQSLGTDYERVRYLVDTLIGFATNDGGGGTAEEYILLRRYFTDSPHTKSLLPKWLRTCHNQARFWNFIKHEFKSYQERREFIWAELTPLLEYCESTAEHPAGESISKVLQRFDEASINAAWQNALKRSIPDPEGAITLARTILESVCKHILDEQGVSYKQDRIDLHELYRMTSHTLNLSPSQHTAEIFKQILGGCTGIVGGLGQLRNKLGDAHGKAKKQVKPAPRHAQLAVNLSGAMALFLVETFYRRTEEG